MFGEGRVLDHVYLERLWRIVLRDRVYLKFYDPTVDFHAELDGFFRFGNKRSAVRSRAPRLCNSNEPHAYYPPVDSRTALELPYWEKQRNEGLGPSYQPPSPRYPRPH